MDKKNLYIGWDIGGAHTKYTISSDARDTVESRTIPSNCDKDFHSSQSIILDSTVSLASDDIVYFV